MRADGACEYLCGQEREKERDKDRERERRRKSARGREEEMQSEAIYTQSSEHVNERLTIHESSNFSQLLWQGSAVR